MVAAVLIMKARMRISYWLNLIDNVAPKSTG